MSCTKEINVKNQRKLMENESKITNRIDVVDALRGFALLGIVIVHFMEQFYAGSPPKGHENFTNHMPADDVFEFFANFFIRGKFFMLFSFLFGVSFSLQMGRAAEKGVNFAWRFAWRLVILLAIGWIHQCFYRGDILTIYAMVGLPLILFYKAKDMWLIVFAAVLMMGTPRILQQISNPAFDVQKSFEEMGEGETVYWEKVTKGSWWDVAIANSTQGFRNKLEFQFGFVGRGYQTFALFLLGLYAGRNRLFENLEDKKRLYRRFLLRGLLALVLLIVIGVLIFLVFKLYEKNKILAVVIGSTLSDVLNLILMIIYIASFLLLYQKKWAHRQLQKLAPYGRMALTNYVLQSVIGTAILFGWGFGQLGKMGSTWMFCIAIAVFIVQRIFSDWWLKHYHFGFLEWVWRSLTFFKIQKFKKG
jgi:uncharacterized protein